ncbi:hypothetical protein PBI_CLOVERMINNIE_39 [Gordonia phage CloverMinnie]|nr:hypothetical protein PBI_CLOVERMINNIE_39 [Gordonia phage CloverMinnie]
MSGLYVGNTPIYAPYVGDTMAHSVYVGDTMVWARDPVSNVLTASGTITLYPYYRFLDIIGLGGGASGQTGSGATNTAGKGGDCGDWLGLTLQRGVDFPESATSLVVVVGVATGRAADSDLAAPINGNATTFTPQGGITYSADGGVGTRSSGQPGLGAGNFTYNGVLYTGGTDSATSAAGNAPGGGGSGGNGGIFGSRTRGWEGARGQAWSVQRNY